MAASKTFSSSAQGELYAGSENVLMITHADLEAEFEELQFIFASDTASGHKFSTPLASDLPFAKLANGWIRSEGTDYNNKEWNVPPNTPFDLLPESPWFLLVVKPGCRACIDSRIDFETFAALHPGMPMFAITSTELAKVRWHQIDGGAPLSFGDKLVDTYPAVFYFDPRSFAMQYVHGRDWRIMGHVYSQLISQLFGPDL